MALSVSTAIDTCIEVYELAWSHPASLPPLSFSTSSHPPPTLVIAHFLPYPQPQSSNFSWVLSSTLPTRSSLHEHVYT